MFVCGIGLNSALSLYLARSHLAWPLLVLVREMQKCAVLKLGNVGRWLLLLLLIGSTLADLCNDSSSDDEDDATMVRKLCLKK